MPSVNERIASTIAPASRRLSSGTATTRQRRAARSGGEGLAGHRRQKGRESKARDRLTFTAARQRRDGDKSHAKVYFASRQWRNHNMDGLVSFLEGVVVLYAVPTILCAPFLMYFSAGGLTFLQSLRIAALSFTVMVSAITLAIEPVIGNEISGAAILLCMSLAGFLITRLAAREGVKKLGWLGVGAKSVLSILALSWIIVAVLSLAGAFGGM